MLRKGNKSYVRVEKAKCVCVCVCVCVWGGGGEEGRHSQESSS